LLSNFKFPYFSRDIAEFWRRWHISLSSWFKDYLYIPLGGSKEGKWKTIRNTFIIFLVSGFWHGASWNFIAWGFIHACGFLPLLLLKRNRRYTSDVVAEGKLFPNVRELFQMLGTFTFVTIAWVFFRAGSLNEASGYLMNIIINNSMKSFWFIRNPDLPMLLLLFLTFIFADWIIRSDERRLAGSGNKVIDFILILIIILSLIYFALVNDKSMFIYFQF